MLYIHNIAKKYWATPSNLWIQVFQSPPWPQAPSYADCFYKHFLKEWVALRSSVNSSVGPVIGCHLCNKSICDISLLINISWSTVSGIVVTKWKQLGTAATQLRSGRPCKMTERGQRMLMRTVHRSRQLSAESTAKDLQTSCGLQISTTMVHRELHGMGFHFRAAVSKPYITKCNAKRRMQWCKTRRHWTLERYLPDCIVPSVKF
ncbi:unnamed protein product, partial [Staurois parvus]